MKGVKCNVVTPDPRRWLVTRCWPGPACKVTELRWNRELELRREEPGNVPSLMTRAITEDWWDEFIMSSILILQEKRLFIWDQQWLEGKEKDPDPSYVAPQVTVVGATGRKTTYIKTRTILVIISKWQSEIIGKFESQLCHHPWLDESGRF